MFVWLVVDADFCAGELPVGEITGRRRGLVGKGGLSGARRVEASAASGRGIGGCGVTPAGVPVVDPFRVRVRDRHPEPGRWPARERAGEGGDRFRIFRRVSTGGHAAPVRTLPSGERPGNGASGGFGAARDWRRVIGVAWWPGTHNDVGAKCEAAAAFPVCGRAATTGVEVGGVGRGDVG